MANGFRPFGNVPDQLAQLAQQKTSPQGQLMEAKLREIQQNSLRNNLLTDFLINADLKNFKTSDIISTVGAITADPNLAIKAAEARLQEGLFSGQQKRLQQLGEDIGGFSGSETEMGTAVGPGEMAQATSRFFQSGGTPQEIRPALGLMQGATTTRRPSYRWRVRMQDGKPTTRQFGSDIRVVEEEINEQGKPTGNVRFAVGGNVSVTTLPDKRRQNLLNRFNADPAVRKAQSIFDASNDIVGLIESKNPIADNAIPTYMARASGEVGNLSEADKRPFGGSQALIQRIKRTIQKATKGTLDDTDREFVRQLAATMQTNGNQRIDKIARLRAKQYSRVSKNVGEEELYQLLNPFSTFETSEEQSLLGDQTPTPESTTAQPTQEEIDRRAKARSYLEQQGLK